MDASIDQHRDESQRKENRLARGKPQGRGACQRCDHGGNEIFIDIKRLGCLRDIRGQAFYLVKNARVLR